jgi:hypothetical protein
MSCGMSAGDMPPVPTIPSGLPGAGQEPVPSSWPCPNGAKIERDWPGSQRAGVGGGACASLPAPSRVCTPPLTPGRVAGGGCILRGAPGRAERAGRKTPPPAPAAATPGLCRRQGAGRRQAPASLGRLPAGRRGPPDGPAARAAAQAGSGRQAARRAGRGPRSSRPSGRGLRP